MKKIFFVFNFLFLCVIAAKEPYYVMGDIDFSSYSGAEDILTFHQGLECGIDSLFKIKNEKKIFGILRRTCGMVLIWYPLSEFEIVVQHEVFGHGYRVRNLGSDIARVEKYEFDAPFPYGDGGGATLYEYSTLTTFDKTLISAGGVESTAVLANRLKMKWISDLRLDPRKLFLYLEAEQDLTSYVYSMNDSIIFENDGHDIESYLFWLNNTYYTDHLSKDDIKKSVLINLVDPTTYYCVGSFFYYIFSGKDMKIPTINIKNLRILPNLRLGLAPYGLEYYLESFMSNTNVPIYSYFRIGNHNQRTFWGFGLEYPGLLKLNLWKIGFRFDLFRQPKIYFKNAMFEFERIQFGYSEEDLRRMIYGVYSSLIIEKRFSNKSYFSVYVEGGYKTNGFIPGQALRESIIFRLGLGFDTF